MSNILMNNGSTWLVSDARVCFITQSASDRSDGMIYWLDTSNNPYYVRDKLSHIKLFLVHFEMNGIRTSKLVFW